MNYTLYITLSVTIHHVKLHYIVLHNNIFHYVELNFITLNWMKRIILRCIALCSTSLFYRTWLEYASRHINIHKADIVVDPIRTGGHTTTFFMKIKWKNSQSYPSGTIYETAPCWQLTPFGKTYMSTLRDNIRKLLHINILNCIHWNSLDSMLDSEFIKN